MRGAQLSQQQAMEMKGILDTFKEVFMEPR